MAGDNSHTMDDFPNWRDYVTEFTELAEAVQKKIARRLKEQEDQLQTSQRAAKRYREENDRIKAESIGARRNLPKLKKTQSGSATSASTGPLSSHAKAEAEYEEYELEDDSDIVPHGHATKTWTERNKTDDTLIYGIEDIITIQSEMQFHGQRPDKYLLYMGTTPIGAVEVKTPMLNTDQNRSEDGHLPLEESTKFADAMANERVQGQVIDYLRLLKNYYGLLNPFCLLTTFHEWRVFWLSDMEREVEGTPTEQVAAEAPKHHIWPTILTELARNDPPRKSLRAAKRKLCCSRIYSTDHSDLLKFISSVVKKMRASEIRTPEFNDLSRTIVQVDCLGWTWQVLEAHSSFSWDYSVPSDDGDAKYYLLTPLGAGQEGRVWLACKNDKRLFAIKFKHPRRPGGEGLSEVESRMTRAELKMEQEKRVQREARHWQLSQPEIGSNVRTEHLDNCLTLLMPFIPQKSVERSLVEKKAAKDAVVAFGNNGFFHKDLSWRHVGFYGTNEEPKAALLDLGYVEEIEEDRKQIAIERMKKDLGLDDGGAEHQ